MQRPDMKKCRIRLIPIFKFCVMVDEWMTVMLTSLSNFENGYNVFFNSMIYYYSPCVHIHLSTATAIRYALLLFQN